jgi:hypothetical protein
MLAFNKVPAYGQMGQNFIINFLHSLSSFRWNIKLTAHS